MKKAIISGGCGFIGSNLIKHLLKKKYFVINIDNLSYSANKNYLKDLRLKNYIFFKSDINNKELIYKILNKYKPTYFFNLAAETHVDRSIDNPEKFIKSNIVSVFILLQTLRKYLKTAKTLFKFIHVSTDEVYGDLSKIKQRASEDYPYRPSSPYAASKASSDHLIKSYIRTYNFPAIISNCSNNYGPNQYPEKLIPKIILNIINNKNIPLYDKGMNLREWIYVEDHCRALELLAKYGKIGENYNIGSNISLSNLKIAKLIIKEIKRLLIKKNINSKIIFVKDRPGHDFRYAINSSKIRKKFKWKPLINVKKGISLTVSWYIKNLKYFDKIQKKNLGRLGTKI